MLYTSRLELIYKTRILLILGFVIVLGYVIDIFFAGQSPSVQLLNGLCVGAVSIAFALHFLKLISMHTAFALPVYSVMFNIVASLILDPASTNEFRIVRSLLIASLLIPAAAFVLGRKHALYLGALNLVWSLSAIILQENIHLLQQIPMFILLISGYSLGVYYLIFLFEKSSSNEKKLLDDLHSINDDSMFLNSLSFKLVDYYSETETLPFILKSIKEHTGATFATFSVYDEKQKALVLKSIDADGILLGTAVKIAGKSILNTASPVDDFTYQEIIKEMVGRKNTFTEVTFGAIGEKTDKSFRKISGVSVFYGIAHIISGKLYGTTCLGYKDSQGLPSEETLRSYGHVTALLLRRNLNEKALEVSENNLRRITENITDVVFTGDLNLNLTYITPSIYKLTGFTPDEYLLLPLEKRYPNASMELLKQIYKAEMVLEQKPNVDRNRSRITDLDLIKKDGSVVHTSVHSTFLRDKDGKPVGIQGVVRDVTELLESQKKLQLYSDELKELNSDKDRFLQILAHDLQNPFHIILGLSEALADSSAVLAPDKIQEMARNIFKSTLRTNELLKELLLWANAQAGKLPFNPEVLPFSKICESVLSELHANATRKNISIAVDSSETFTVFADVNMLRTILRNLVSNAIKFSFPDSAILISAISNEQEVIITVTDSGIGISKEDQSKIWDKSGLFTRRGTENEVGTGLGLMLCKEFVEKHNGKLWVQSSPEKGSTFSFSLTQDQKLT